MGNGQSDWLQQFNKAKGRFPLKSLEEARSACDSVWDGTEAYYFALSRWTGFSYKEVEKARTAEQAQRAYDRAPEKSGAKKHAKAKWDDLAAAQAQLARNVAEAEAAIHRARYGSKAREIAENRLHRFVLEELNRVSDLTQYSALYEQSPNTAKSYVYRRWNTAALRALELATTHEEASNVFLLCPKNSIARHVAHVLVNDLHTGEKKHGDAKGLVYLFDGSCVGMALTGSASGGEEKTPEEIRAEYPNIFQRR